MSFGAGDFVRGAVAWTGSLTLLGEGKCGLEGAECAYPDWKLRDAHIGYDGIFGQSTSATN